MISEEKILEALRTIQEVCRDSGSCEKCILRTGADECGVISDTISSPMEWYLRDEERPRLILN